MLTAHHPERAIRRSEVCSIIGYEKTWLHKAIKDPVLRFPAPDKRGRSARWKLGVVLAWQRSQPASAALEVTPTF